MRRTRHRSFMNGGILSGRIPLISLVQFIAVAQHLNLQRAASALGVFIMKIGIGGGPAALPAALIGALLAGIGLRATNAPVTNTTTGSVSSDRAGMASGIDMSARMISLAINIALMGFVLLEGVLKRLSAASGSFDAARLRHVAEQIGAGNVAFFDQSATGVSKALGPAALAGGFGDVMLYGAFGVRVLAALAFFTFGRRRDADNTS